MSNILLVEPNYRSKFPPLGLMKIANYHKGIGDQITFVRGNDQKLRDLHWHRIYVSSLFTWELPRTVKTVKYYASAVNDPKDIYIGGIGATLLPDYVRKNVECTLIEGQLDSEGLLGQGSPVIAEFSPDYSILDSIDYSYYPKDAYFVKITKGCIRKCKFCAVPLLEKEFGMLKSLSAQIAETDSSSGPKHDLVIMDNNTLGIESIETIISDIVDAGFHAGARAGNRFRTVDFNQGLDARLISKNPKIAKMLSRICLTPVRLAYDFAGIKRSYMRAVRLLNEKGFHKFTNYMLFNFDDSPRDFYDRLIVNISLNIELGIRITGFPMRFIPMTDVTRGYVSNKWKWKYLRGIQCILLATRGLVSPNPEFVLTAFGENYQEFLEILSMPERYIINRFNYADNAAVEWRKDFRALDQSKKNEFLSILERLHKDPNRKCSIQNVDSKYRSLLEHYYPNGGCGGG